MSCRRATRARTMDWVAFSLAGGASIGLISLVDQAVWLTGGTRHPWLASLAHHRIPSLTVCFLSLLLAGGADALRWPRAGPGTWRRIGLLSAAWLLGTCVTILGIRIWTPPLGFRDGGDFFAFLVAGLLAEELLFRGTLQGLARRLFPEGMLMRPGPAIWIVALLFTASHLQYHHFRLTPGFALQASYVLPLGLVLGGARAETGSLWPGVALHFATNAISVARLLV